MVMKKTKLGPPKPKVALQRQLLRRQGEWMNRSTKAHSQLQESLDSLLDFVDATPEFQWFQFPIERNETRNNQETIP